MEEFAENINYWKTGTSSPDTWIEKAKNQIIKLGGKVMVEGFGSEPDTGRAAYMLGFKIEGVRFKAVWPVMQTRNGKDEKAARRQAATMLYHDIKAKCISATVKGPRVAFFEYLLLPDGRSASEASEKELLTGIPDMISRTLMLETE